MNTAHNLRQDLQSYRYYLLNAISEWEVQAINNFKALKERIEAALVAYASQAKINDRDREKEK
jgi:proline dehydrogenase